MHEGAPGEFEIIARYFSRHSGRDDVLLGVGDDAAVLEVPAGRRLVAAVDTLVQDVHFPSGVAAADIGYRALAVNLSDLAAMGAEPAWTLLSLSLPWSDAAWLEEFAAGFYGLADRYGVALVGGDTVRGPLVLTVEVLGLVEPDRVLTRGGARPGDYVYVSGVPGEAAAGLAVIQGAIDGPSTAHLRQRFLRPEPRVALGRVLRPFASAAMDVSDGLLGDLAKLCRSSRWGARLDLENLPVSAAMQAHFDARSCESFALAGGDDYELLFTVPPERAAEVEARTAALVPCTRIGVMTHDATAAIHCFRDGEPVAMPQSGFDHFSVDRRA